MTRDTPSNRNANAEELSEARRLLAEAQRATKKTGQRIEALARAARERRT